VQQIKLLALWRTGFGLCKTNRLICMIFTQIKIIKMGELFLIARETFSYLVPHHKTMFSAFLRHALDQKSCKSKKDVRQAILRAANAAENAEI
jgi:hypothetical protein